MLKIVYCTIECSQAAGTERSLALQANYFAERGDEVHIVTTDAPRSAVPAFHFSGRIHFHCLDINYGETDGRHSLGKYVRRLSKGWLHRRRLSALLRDIRPDITVALFNHEVTFLHQLHDGSRKVQQFHFSYDFLRLSLAQSGLPRWRQSLLLFTQWCRRRHISRYDAFVVLTHEDARAWSPLSNLHVIPNACSITPSRCADYSRRRVISAGRLSPEKGFDKLIHAWSLLPPELSDWQLHIYGQGDLQGQLQRQIDVSGLSHRVQLLPPVSDIGQEYLASSIYVMSSRNEGFPMVLPEAMSCGLPCVSFACPCGPSEIITDGIDGYLVPPGDVEVLAERLSSLMRSEDMRRAMGQAARQNVRRFSPARVMPQWESLFTELLSRPICATDVSCGVQ